jgi:hypothetical protein
MQIRPKKECFIADNYVPRKMIGKLGFSKMCLQCLAYAAGVVFWGGTLLEVRMITTYLSH